MQAGHTMTTLSEKMKKLKEEGYDVEFKISGNKLISDKTNHKYDPEELTIVKTFRFEGESDPGDMSVLYAIESGKNEKGILIDAFGTYANNESEDSNEILKKIKIKDQD